jgi:predicted TIM-barrel fold metal-dependent hydrolase
MSISSL